MSPTAVWSATACIAAASLVAQWFVLFATALAGGEVENP